jgi:hypothetical protein
LNACRIDLFWHAQAVQACLRGLEAQASFDLPRLNLEVRGSRGACKLTPRFFVRDERGVLQYSSLPERAALGFAGWLPYAGRRWPLGGNIAFKALCLRHGLQTPPMWRSPAAGMSDFLVKRDRSVFSAGMRGPFRAYRADDSAQAPGDDRFYERFVPGRSVKAWFWEDRLAAIEAHDMPKLTGDGRSTLRELMQRASRTGGAHFRWDRLGDLARFQDAALDAPLEAGRTVIADLHWGSSLIPSRIEPGSTLAAYKGSALLRELQAAGPILWRFLPEGVRAATLFTVDAILDEQARLWLLEMNCEPMGHPDAYAPMLDTLLARRLDS